MDAVDSGAAASSVSQAASVVAEAASTASAKVDSTYLHSQHLPLPDTSILLHPASVLLLVALFSTLLKKVGKDRMVACLSPIHLRIARGGVLKRQKELKEELFKARQEMAKTSSQDEFAKWAKLRRKVDKTLADLEAINASLAGSRSSLTLMVRAALFILGTCLPFAVSTWYRKTPIFWLPPAAAFGAKGHTVSSDWLGPIGWMLSLPSAPRGSISATVWSQVCGRVIALVFSAIYDLLLFVTLIKDPSAQTVVKTKPPGQPLVTSTPLRIIWCSLGLASCSYAYSRLYTLENLLQALGIDLSTQYGGLWQFLTNLGLVATMATLLLSLTDALLPSSLTFKLKQGASLICLPGETLIFLLYWSLVLFKPELMVPSLQVTDPSNPDQLITKTIRLPLLTDLTLHGIPAVFLLIEHLFFSPGFPILSRSSFPEAMVGPLVANVAYSLWVEQCARRNGHFPYPVLQVLPLYGRVMMYLGCAVVLFFVLKGLEAVRWWLSCRTAIDIANANANGREEREEEKESLKERKT